MSINILSLDKNINYKNIDDIEYGRFFIDLENKSELYQKLSKSIICYGETQQLYRVSCDDFKDKKYLRLVDVDIFIRGYSDVK